jgi:hypothetical protein
MASNPTFTTGQNLPPPQVPIVDPKTGIFSADGWKFIVSLIQRIASAIPTLTVATSVAAAGATQATATPLTKQSNTVTSGAGGVLLLNLQAGQSQTVRNRSGNNVSVYPPAGSQIEALGANAPSTVANGADATFFFDTTMQIWI